MFKNYVAAAIGNFKKHKFTSIVNLLGLTICLGAFVLIILFVRYELSYDQQHTDAERIYRLTETLDAGSYVENSSSVSFPVLPALMRDYPDMIESGVRIFDQQLPLKTIKLEDDRLFNETGIYFADSNIFEFFNIPLLIGDAATVLDKPRTVAISEKLARKYFGDENPVGKLLFYGGSDKLSLEITGVFTFSGPSHFNPNAIISLSTYVSLNPYINQNWVWNPCWSYLRLAPNVSPETLESRFDEFVQAHYIERLKTMASHQLQPLTDIHLHSGLEFEMGPNSNMKYIYIFISAGVFLLIVGCINYINLSTIGYFARTKELGIRKVVGAVPGQLKTQILLESMIFTFVACLGGFVLLLVALKPFANRLQVAFRMEDLLHLPTLLALVAFLLVTGILAGLYPALRFSQTAPVSIFQGSVSGGPSGLWFRNALVVVQFSLSIILIVFALSARRQLNFMYGNDKGFDDENVLLFKITGNKIPLELQAFKNEMKKHPQVENVTMMNEMLGVTNNNHEYNYEGLPANEWHYFPALAVEEDFTRTFDMTLLAGRTFDQSLANEDSLSVIINEAMVRFLGFTDPAGALNKRMHSLSGREKIIGVVEDFHFKSLHHPIGPMVLDIENRTNGNYYFFAKLAAVKVKELNPDVLAHMERVWKSMVTHQPFDYRLLSTEIKNQYKTEDRMTILLDLFTVTSVVVALMGLYALSRFLAYFKTKEIAIRKVFGAETRALLILAGKEQFWLMMISLLIALPVAWFAVDYWLQSFSYRMEQSTSIYVFTGFGVMLLSMATVALISLKAIRTNTIEVLQYE